MKSWRSTLRVTSRCRTYPLLRQRRSTSHTNPPHQHYQHYQHRKHQANHMTSPVLQSTMVSCFLFSPLPYFCLWNVDVSSDRAAERHSPAYEVLTHVMHHAPFLMLLFQLPQHSNPTISSCSCRSDKIPATSLHFPSCHFLGTSC
jgi:hypothetical protein